MKQKFIEEYKELQSRMLELRIKIQASESRAQDIREMYDSLSTPERTSAHLNQIQVELDLVKFYQKKLSELNPRFKELELMEYASQSR